jgi:hypothetical protein
MKVCGIAEIPRPRRGEETFDGRVDELEVSANGSAGEVPVRAVVEFRAVVLFVWVVQIRLGCSLLCSARGDEEGSLVFGQEGRIKKRGYPISRSGRISRDA